MNARRFNAWIVGMIVAATIAGFIAGMIAGRAIPRSSKVYIDMGTRTITAYQAVEAQCDATPDIGAGGRVAINGKPTGKWFACNWLPFGTKIVIPSITGDIVWTCRDRMNKRFPHRVDLLISKGAAGVGCRPAKVFVVKSIEK